MPHTSQTQKTSLWKVRNRKSPKEECRKCGKMLQKTTDYKHAKNGHPKLSKNQLNVPDIPVFNTDTVGPCTYSDWSKAHVRV